MYKRIFFSRLEKVPYKVVQFSQNYSLYQIYFSICKQLQELPRLYLGKNMSNKSSNVAIVKKNGLYTESIFSKPVFWSKKFEIYKDNLIVKFNSNLLCSELSQEYLQVPVKVEVELEKSNSVSTL